MKRFFLLVLLFAVIGCKGRGESEKLRLVIGFMPHVQFTPLYAGIKNGFFNENGVELVIDYGFGIDAFSLLNNKQSDLALSDSDQLIISASKGLELYTFYQYYKYYPTSIVSLNTYDSPLQLSGKKIGVPELFGTSYIGLLKFLSHYDLNEKVTIERIGYSQIPALLSNKTDAVVCFYNNEPIQLRMKDYNITEWKVGDITNLAGASFITGKKQIDEKKDKLIAFNKAMSKSIDWVNENIDSALDISYSHIGTLNESDREFWREVLVKTMEVINGHDNKPGVISRDQYDESIAELYELGLLSKKISSKDIIRADIFKGYTE